MQRWWRRSWRRGRRRRRRRRWRMMRRRRRTTVIKSNNPHLAGGEFPLQYNEFGSPVSPNSHLELRCETPRNRHFSQLWSWEFMNSTAGGLGAARIASVMVEIVTCITLVDGVINQFIGVSHILQGAPVR